MGVTDGLIIGVDAGGSKTDVVALTALGELAAHVRGPGASPQIIGLERAVSVVSSLIGQAAAGGEVRHASLFVSGLDLPEEIRRYADAIATEPWWDSSTTADNDLFALLRAGTEARDAVAVICGTGINAIGVRSDGATARYPALGQISGDWGGGSGIGQVALWHAARGGDGRGPRTELEQALPRMFDAADLAELIERLHFGDQAAEELHRATPVVLQLAAAGDAVSRQIVVRQGVEIATMAAAAIERLDLVGTAVPVVLGGGVVRSRDPLLLATIEERLGERVPLARVELLRSAPITGAGLLALEQTTDDAAVLLRARAQLELI